MPEGFKTRAQMRDYMYKIDSAAGLLHKVLIAKDIEKTYSGV